MLSKREAQLQRWHLTITRLEGAVHGVGSQKDFEALVYLDELKLLHAIAQSKLEEYKSSDHPKRRQLRAGLNRAWSDLGVAIDNLDL
jgi:hypothetical protein